MRNIPIIGKFLLILSAFGVFTLLVAVYACGQMWKIDSSYTALGLGPETAAMDVAQANRAQATARRSIADLVISNTDAQNQAANHDLQAARKDFIEYFDEAAKAEPANAADYEALKARGLEILDQTCAATIKAGLATNNQAAAVASQTLYLKDCAPAFPALAADMKKKAKEVIADAHKQDNALTEVTKGAITATFLLIVGGLVGVMVGAFFSTRAWIVAPMKSLSSIMDRLAKGDFQVRIEGEGRRDELGGMARAVKVFKDAGLENRGWRLKPSPSAV